MLNRIIQKIAFTNSVRLGKQEKMDAIREYGNKSLLFPPIFIIGVPRCGSTVFYQAITNAFDIVFFTNYAMKQYPSILRGMKKSFEKYSNKRHSYQSVLGDTEKLYEPSEGSYFWYQWFPYHKHYLTRDDISEDAKKEIYSLVNAMVHQHDKPLIFKNLNCSQRIDLLTDIFKDVIFIHLKRSPAEVIRSMYKAKKHRGLNDNDWFSVKSKNYELLKSKSGLDQLCAQYKDLNDQIITDLAQIPSKHQMEVTYEAFCANPVQILTQVHQFLESQLGSVNWREQANFDKIHKNKFFLNAQMEKELETYLTEYGLNG